MAAAPGTTNLHRSRAVAVSAAWVLLMVAVAVGRGGIVLWVRWTAAAVAILIVVGLVVLTRKLPRPPRPAGYGKDIQAQMLAQMLSGIAGMSSVLLANGLGITWQGDAPLLVLAGVLGSIPFLALTWWRVLHPNRTTDTGQPPQ
jgi:hypothetical protein